MVCRAQARCGNIYLEVCAANDIDLEILPGDTDMLVLDPGALVRIVRGLQELDEVEPSLVFFWQLFQVMALFCRAGGSCLGVIMVGSPGKLALELVEDVFCALDIDMVVLLVEGASAGWGVGHGGEEEKEGGENQRTP